MICVYLKKGIFFTVSQTLIKGGNMTEIKRKRDSHKIIAFMIIIALIITMLPLVAMGGDESDITESGFVDYDGYEMFRANKLIASSADGAHNDLKTDPLKSGDELTVKYFWNVKKSHTITAGSFFMIDLPDAFAFDGMTADLKTDDGIKIGKIDVLPATQQLKITLDATGVGKLPLVEGWVMITGGLKEADESTTSVAFHEIIIPVDISGDEEENGGNDGDPKRHEPKDKFPQDGDGPSTIFGKGSSSINSSTGFVSYTLSVNYDNYHLKFEKNSGYKDLKNVIIEDKLPENVVYAGDLRAYVPAYTAKGVYTTYSSISGTNDVDVKVEPVEPTAMSGNIFKYSYIEFDERIPSDPTMDYADFKEFMKKQDPMTYGIWQHKAIVMNLGDIQGDVTMGCTWGELKDSLKNHKKEGSYTTYERNASGEALNTSGGSWVIDGGTLAEKKVTFSAITEDIRTETLKAYAPFFGIQGSGINESVNDSKTGDAVGFSISFKANVHGESRSITNHAIMMHETSSKGATSWPQKYTQISGGAKTANPGDIVLYKLDGETNEPLAEVQFKLQKWNKASDKFEDLEEGANGSGIHTTDEDGRVIFKQPDYGRYKIVEVKGLEGYSAEVRYFNHNTEEWQDTFELADSIVIQVTGFNYEEDIAGEESVPPDENVLGEEEYPEDTMQEGAVLGEEAQTADITNIIPLLIILLIAMFLILAVTLKNHFRKE